MKRPPAVMPAHSSHLICWRRCRTDPSAISSDVLEDFVDLFRTDVWWVGGAHADGQFVMRIVRPHQRLPAHERSGAADFPPFPAECRRRYFRPGGTNLPDKSTDVLTSVDVRLQGSGAAWLGVRSSLVGDTLEGYRLEVQRREDGSLSAVVRYVAGAENLILSRAAAGCWNRSAGMGADRW